MYKEFIEYVAKEMGVIQGAPLVFFAALAVIILVVWRLMEWRYGPKNDLIELYKAQLDGASPEEARARVQGLEDIIKKTIGSDWTPLTLGEAQQLSKELKTVEKRRIQVMYQNVYGKDLARSIADAFEAAEWDVLYSMGGGFEAGVFVGRSPTVGPKLKAAIERSTQLTVIYERPVKGWEDDTASSTVYVAVGPNPN